MSVDKTQRSLVAISHLDSGENDSFTGSSRSPGARSSTATALTTSGRCVSTTAEPLGPFCLRR